MATLKEMARDLGEALARTDEYKELRRAIQKADDDREIVELRNELESLEEKLEGSLRKGDEPDRELVKEYEELVGKLQRNATYQRLVAAQSNFDKVVRKVNDTISEGIEAGAESRIVLPS